MGNESSTLGLLLNLAQLEADLRAGAVAGRPQVHGWDPKDCSDNMEVKDDGLLVVRKPSSTKRTDCVRGKKAYTSGVHIWEITWPRDQRGSHAVVGVAAESTPLTCPGFTSLVGSNDQSLGWDIAKNELIFNDCVIRSYPDEMEDNNFKAPDVITVILNMDVGTISFKGGGEDYGLALSGLKKIGHGLCPAVSAVYDGCKVGIKYIGGSGGSPLLRLLGDDSLRFHKTKGDNIILSNGDRTAERKSALETPKEGVLVSSRPLKNDEKFEVTLDKAIGKHDGALKIGIVGVPFSIPSTVSKAEPQKIWYWDGGQVYHNGEVIKTLNITLDAALEGEKIGIVRKSDGTLHCLYKGRDLGVVATETPDKFHGIVDVYGSTAQVTLKVDEIAGQNLPRGFRSSASDADLIVKRMSSTIELMKDRNVGSIRHVKNAVRENLIGPYVHPKYFQYRQLMGDKLAEIGGAKVILEYLKFLQPASMGDHADIFICYDSLLNVCVSYSDNSLKFARDLIDHDILSIVIHDLKKFKDSYKDSKRQESVVTSSLIIAHNCAKPAESKATYHEKQMTTYLKPYISSDHSPSTQMVALLGLSYIISPREHEHLTAQPETIAYILETLRECLNSSNHKYEGCSAYELTVGLTNLAINLDNRRNFVANGFGALLERLMKSGNDGEKECAADALLAMTSDETRAKLKQLTPGLLPTLDDLSKSRSEGVRQAAVRAKTKLVGSSSFGQVLGRPGSETPSAASKSRPNCPHRAMCKGFKDTLKIDDAFFEPQFDICYCNDCHMARGDNLYYSRGLPAKAKALKADQEWHRAYHGTKKEAVLRMLESGEILMPGDVALGGMKIKEREGHFDDNRKPEGFDTKQVFVSPSIRYAGHDAYATPNKFIDPNTKKTYKARVALQVFIRPGSYETGNQTIGATGRLDPKFSNQELEWSTKERGACILYGLLVKVSG